MLNLIQSIASSSARRGGFLLLVLGLALLVSACGSTAVRLGGGAQVVSYVYRASDSFVRIERIESGASPNAHPYRIPAVALRQLLAGLQIEGSTISGTTPLFTSGELEELAAPLAAALEKVGPGEDVTFAVGAPRGFFGAYSPKAYTTGRAFVSGSRLNILFGVVHERFDDTSAGRPADMVPGSRAGRVDFGWSIVPAIGRVTGERTDWVMFDQTVVPTVTTPAVAAPSAPVAPAAAGNVPAPATPAAPASVPNADRRFQEIETRLTVLDQLKAKGLITEQEYQAQRRAVLQGI